MESPIPPDSKSNRLLVVAEEVVHGAVSVAVFSAVLGLERRWHDNLPVAQSSERERLVLADAFDPWNGGSFDGRSLMLEAGRLCEPSPAEEEDPLSFLRRNNQNRPLGNPPLSFLREPQFLQTKAFRLQAVPLPRGGRVQNATTREKEGCMRRRISLHLRIRCDSLLFPRFVSTLDTSLPFCLLTPSNSSERKGKHNDAIVPVCRGRPHFD